MIVDDIDGEYVERPSMGEQFDLLAQLHTVTGACRYGVPEVGRCTAPATHLVVGVTEAGPHRPERHEARLECCLDHANYYARGWLHPHLLYPGVRGAVWIEQLALVAS